LKNSAIQKKIDEEILNAIRHGHADSPMIILSCVETGRISHGGRVLWGKWLTAVSRRLPVGVRMKYTMFSASLSAWSPGRSILTFSFSSKKNTSLWFTTR
jgi:hypothetical protein